MSKRLVKKNSNRDVESEQERSVEISRNIQDTLQSQ